MRFFMCYGPGERPDPFRSAMTNFIDRVRHDRPITVHRGTSRSWCYIDDIVAGCRLLMENWDGERYEGFNIGRGDPQPTTDVAALICEMLDKPTSLIELAHPGPLVIPSRTRHSTRHSACSGTRRRSGCARASSGRSPGTEATQP